MASEIVSIVTSSQGGSDSGHVAGRKLGQNRVIDQGGRFLIGHADITRPFQGEGAVGRGLVEGNAERRLEAAGDGSGGAAGAE